MKYIQRESVIKEAAVLLSDGENTEYDRAITEFAGALLGIPSDYHESLHQIIRAVKGD